MADVRIPGSAARLEDHDIGIVLGDGQVERVAPGPLGRHQGLSRPADHVGLDTDQGQV